MNLRKEMIVAIVLGLILGGVAAVLVTQAPQKFFNKNGSLLPTPETNVTETPIPTPEQSLSLDVLFPQDQSLAESKELTVSGKTKVGATVLVTTPFDEKVMVASDDGTFSIPIVLSEGANEVSIVALHNGADVEKSVMVNYTTEDL